MGYSTGFSGSFILDRPLEAPLAKYFREFVRIRHMKRDVEKIKSMDTKWEEHCFNGMIGWEGSYYIPPLRFPVDWIDPDQLHWEAVPENGFIEKEHGDIHDRSVVEYNIPPENIPGLWCHWCLERDDQTIVWNKMEKTYAYVSWLRFLIDKFFKPYDYRLNGTVSYQGDSEDDGGNITVIDNEISVTGTCLYGGRDWAFWRELSEIFIRNKPVEISMTRTSNKKVSPYRVEDLKAVLSNVPDSVEEIWVFGSTLTPNCRPQSDLDLCIIGNTTIEEESKMYKAAKCAVDIITDTPEEFAEHQKIAGSIYKDVVDKGLMVYKKGTDIKWM